jgi:glycosyltransferase involved in cell wall biosynthesis
VRYRQNVERAVEELRRNRPNLKLELRTEFLSNAEFVNALNCCDYILAPYLEFYGSSGVLGQAARLGKPVLSCRDGLLGEIVRKQSLGVTFDPSNALEFAHVIQSAVEGEVHIDLDSAKKFISTQSAEKFCQEITGI